MNAMMVGLMLMVLAGCDGGTWLNVPGTSSKDCDDLAKAEGQAKENIEEGLKAMGQVMCLQSGKNYTGDSRCDDGNIQVKCK